METDSARLIVRVFGSYNQAAKILKVSRQAAHHWATRDQIPEDRLSEIRTRFAGTVRQSGMVETFNKLGQPHSLRISD